MGFEFVASGRIERYCGPSRGWRLCAPAAPLRCGDRLKITPLPPRHALLYAYREGDELFEVDLTLNADGSLRGEWQGSLVTLALEDAGTAARLRVYIDLFAEVPAEPGGCAIPLLP